MKLLIIRPQPGADATAARIVAAGHEALVMPLFAVQPLEWNVPTPDSYDALLLTSGNAARLAGAGLGGLRGLPVFAVGSATARGADDAGLMTIAVGQHDVTDLLSIAQKSGHRNLIWLAGEDRIAVSVPDEMTLDTRIVYRSAALPTPEDFTDNILSVAAILLHSPRAARHFVTLCDDRDIDRSGLTIGTLSPAIAASAGSGWKAVVTPPAPNDASLLSQLQSYFRCVDSDPQPDLAHDEGTE